MDHIYRKKTPKKRLLIYRPITRFVDHMHSEHEVKHEPEVILAVSVSYLDFVCGPCDLKGTRLPFESSQDLVTFLSYCLFLKLPIFWL